MAKMKMKKIKNALILGAAVAIGTAPLTGLLNSLLSFVPSMSIAEVIVPHGVLAAGTIAFVTDMLIEKYLDR